MGRDRIETADGRAVVFLFGDVDMAREAEVIAKSGAEAGTMLAMRNVTPVLELALKMNGVDGLIPRVT